MADEVRKHDKTMGETGQGLESEREIAPGTPLAQTWGECISTAQYVVQCLPVCCPKLRSSSCVRGITK